MSTAISTTTHYAHIELAPDGVPTIVGTTMKVVELIMAQTAHGWSPEELHFQFPHLSLSQIHSALAFYWAHKAVLDADIDRRSAVVSQARRETESTAETKNLRSRLART